MAITYRCDRCGKELPEGSAHRYVVRVEVFAAEGPIEITAEDLERDRRAEIERLVDDLSRTPIEQIEDSTYRALRFDLCPECHTAYLRDPLGGAGT